MVVMFKMMTLFSVLWLFAAMDMEMIEAAKWRMREQPRCLR